VESAKFASGHLRFSTVAVHTSVFGFIPIIGEEHWGGRAAATADGLTGVVPVEFGDKELDGIFFAGSQSSDG